MYVYKIYIIYVREVVLSIVRLYITYMYILIFKNLCLHKFIPVFVFCLQKLLIKQLSNDMIMK